MMWKLQLPDFVKREGHISPKCSISFSHDNHFMAVASNSPKCSVYIWQIRDKHLIHEIAIPNYDDCGVSSISFVGQTNVLLITSFDGQTIFIDSLNSNLICRAPVDQKVILTDKPHIFINVQISFSDASWDGSFVAFNFAECPSIISIWSLGPILDVRVRIGILFIYNFVSG